MFLVDLWGTICLTNDGKMEMVEDVYNILKIYINNKTLFSTYWCVDDVCPTNLQK